MSLSRKLSALDEAQKKEIDAHLQEYFPNSVEVQVFFHVVEWMESQSWETIAETSNLAAQSSMNSIIMKLQEKISRMEDEQQKQMIQYLQDSIKNDYGDNPVEMLKALHKIYLFVENLVNKMAKDEDDDEFADIHEKLKNIEILLKENDEHISEIKQKLKERELILFSQDELEIEKLKILNGNASNNLQGNSVKISEFNKRINRNTNYIPQLNQSIISSLKPLYENISSPLVCTKNKDLQGRIWDEISEWHYNKQRAQVGWPVFTFSFLQPLIPVCGTFAEILFKTYAQTQELVDFSVQIGAKEESKIQIERLKNLSKSMLSSFLKRCFIVEDYPPQILPTDKTFTASLRLLLGSRFLSSSQASTVTCSLHLEDEIRGFYDVNFENIKVQDENKNNVKNNEKAFAYDRETDTFIVSFDKLSLNKPDKRKTKLRDDKTTKLVTDQISCLMFQSEITIASENFKIEAFSLPIVVIRNTNQYVESEATIFWDDAFADKNRKPFISPEKVRLQDFLKALNQRWTKSNQVELKDYHLNYLARKLFPDKRAEELTQCYVTKEMFHKVNMKGPWKFSFWSWFHKTMNLVEKFMLNEWQDGKIYGFIDKFEAEQKLNESLVGTFLLRFTDSIPGGISIAYKESMEGSTHVIPWTKDDLRQKPLSDGLRDLQYLAYLYPAVPKDQAFEMYYSETDENRTEDFNPRYPKKAPIRIVRHDDSRSTASTSNFSSNQSISNPSTSFAPSDSAMSNGTDGNVMPFSPSSLLPLDDDPLLIQANLYDPIAIEQGPLTIDEMDEYLFRSC